MNKIVQAIPTAMYLNAQNKVKDEIENNIPKINKGKISSFVIFKECFLINFIQIAYKITAIKYR